jgi:secreted trypsin-like serine protease
MVIFKISLENFTKTFFLLGTTSSVKTKIVVLVVKNNICADTYATKRISNHHICVQASNLSTCLDDSGGGLIYSPKGGGSQISYLLGISSYQPNCENGSPLVYTTVSDYVNWIVAKMN